MTKEELAAMLNGREYGEEITNKEIKEAEAQGLVVVYGYSDDNMEFKGAIEDEIGCYDGGYVYVKNGRIMKNKCYDEDCPYFDGLLANAWRIDAVWESDGYSWIYNTKIPHATFDIIEDGEKYCRGIVFHVDDTREIAHA